MNKNQRQEIEESILFEITKTEQSIDDLGEQTKPIAPENAIGRISRMDAINNKSVAEAALRKAKEKLINLQQVLEHLDQSDFGQCLKCKRPIPIGRILLMPGSRFCVNCAE